jgi:hypothetical protein
MTTPRALAELAGETRIPPPSGWYNTHLRRTARATRLHFPQSGSRGQQQRYANPDGESCFSANSGEWSAQFTSAGGTIHI